MFKISRALHHIATRSSKRTGLQNWTELAGSIVLQSLPRFEKGTAEANDHSLPIHYVPCIEPLRAVGKNMPRWRMLLFPLLGQATVRGSSIFFMAELMLSLVLAGAGNHIAHVSSCFLFPAFTPADCLEFHWALLPRLIQLLASRVVITATYSIHFYSTICFAEHHRPLTALVPSQLAGIWEKNLHVPSAHCVHIPSQMCYTCWHAPTSMLTMSLLTKECEGFHLRRTSVAEPVSNWTAYYLSGILLCISWCGVWEVRKGNLLSLSLSLSLVVVYVQVHSLRCPVVCAHVWCFDFNPGASQISISCAR